MAQISLFPTPETYQSALASVKEFGEIQLRFAGDLTERQKEFLSTWWQQQFSQASALSSIGGPSQGLEAASKGITEDVALLQKHAKATIELFSSTSDAVLSWYGKQVAQTPAAAAPPARVSAPTATKAA